MARKEVGMPQWVSDEISNVEFQKPVKQQRVGYILEVYDKDRKVDVQIYDPVEDGRHIVTMDLPASAKPAELQKGTVYSFAFKEYKAPLNKKTAEYLEKEKNVLMSAIYQFKLESLKMIDANSDESAAGTGE